MDRINIQIFLAAVLIMVGVYQMVRADALEASLYILAGLAFAFNQMASAERFQAYKKVLVSITWILMIVTMLLFLWVLQFHTL